MGDFKFEVEIKEMPEFFVAYIRHVGPYNLIGPVFERIGKWVGMRGLWNADTKALAAYFDDPGETPPEELRSDACIVVPEGTEGEGEVKTQVIPGGLFAVAHVEIDHTQFADAWGALMGWIQNSGYIPNNGICYEIYLNDPDSHPEGKFIVDICEPVKPA
jgi:AraC family transcriptional regulator